MTDVIVDLFIVYMRQHCRSLMSNYTLTTLSHTKNSSSRAFSVFRSIIANRVAITPSPARPA